MRIAIPIHSFEPGGVERVALRLAKSWAQDGQDIVVVLGRDRGLCRGEAPDLEYRTMREPVPTDRWETLWMIWSLFQFLLTEDVDAIFCPGNTYTVVCIAMKLLLGRRCPPVLVKISNDLERRDMPSWQRVFYARWLKIQGVALDRFIALAEPMRPELRRELGVSSYRVGCVPDPALSMAELQTLGRRQPNCAPTNMCRFVSVGRLWPQKNHGLMIEAFARHAWPGDTLVIAGEGPERTALEALVERLGLGERVSLPGHVAHVAELLSRSDVFLLSSQYEGVPAAILEALAAGLPIVSTDCCASMRWLTGNGRFGVVIDEPCAETFGAAMNVVRHIQPPRESMRELASRFTLERSSRLYLEEFAELRANYRKSLQEDLAMSVRDWTRRGV